MPRICIDVSFDDAKDCVLMRNLVLDFMASNAGCLNAVRMHLPSQYENMESIRVSNPWELTEPDYVDYCSFINSIPVVQSESDELAST